MGSKGRLCVVARVADAVGRSGVDAALGRTAGVVTAAAFAGRSETAGWRLLPPGCGQTEAFSGLDEYREREGHEAGW